MAKYTQEEFEEAVKNSFSVSGVLRYLRLNVTGSSHSYVKNKIGRLGLDRSHFQHNNPEKPSSKKHYSAILVANSELKCRITTKTLRRALLESGCEYRCEKCSNSGEWYNDSLILEIDHRNGDWRDNTLENVRFLCPNCHSQTSNFYRSKSVKAKKQRKTSGRPGKLKGVISKDDLAILLWEISTVEIARRFGVSDKAIEKLAKKYQLIKPARGYWAKKRKNDLSGGVV